MPTPLSKEQKKIRIALAAIDVFGDKGFDRTRIEDVAKAADVGKGTIYEYFSGKKALMEGAMEVLAGHMMESFLPPENTETTHLEKLKEMTNQTVKAIRHVAHAYRFFLEYMIIAGRTEGGSGTVRDLLMDYRLALTTLIEGGIEAGEFRDDIDPKGTAAAFAAWFDGAIFHWMVLPDEGTLESMAAAYIDMVLRGIEAPAPSTPERCRS